MPTKTWAWHAGVESPIARRYSIRWQATRAGAIAMTFAELLSSVQALSRADRLRLIQFLVGEIAREEGVAPLEADKDYPVWTPYNAFEGASTLLGALKQENGAASRF